jgi:hypothetical protein
MTNQSLHFAPGCYGSAVMYRLTASECVACEFASSCADVVREIEPEALQFASRLGNLLGSSRTLEIAKWWNGRWKVPKTAQRASDRSADTLKRWADLGLNAHLLRHKINPLKSSQDQVLYEAFKFMLTERAFKPRDVVEHLRDSIPEKSKASLTRDVKNTCDALLSLGVIKKEGHVLCL